MYRVTVLARRVACRVTVSLATRRWWRWIWSSTTEVTVEGTISVIGWATAMTAAWRWSTLANFGNALQGARLVHRRSPTVAVAVDHQGLRIRVHRQRFL